MSTNVDELPPRGHYLADEVGRLAGVSGNTIGQWARRGYIHASQSSDGFPLVYSYQDAAEAMVVHLLLERNVAHRAIKEAIGLIRSATGLSWPLSNSPIRIPTDHPMHATKKKPTIAVGESGQWVDVRNGQLVFSNVDLDDIRQDLGRGGWAARDVELVHIEVDPERLSGRPTIKGRRIAAEQVARMALAAAGDWSDIREDYALDDTQIRDAVRWWEQVARFEDHHHDAA